RGRGELHRLWREFAPAAAYTAETRHGARAADGDRYDLGASTGEGRSDHEASLNDVDPQVAFQRRRDEIAAAHCNLDGGGRNRKSARRGSFFAALAGHSGSFRCSASRQRGRAIIIRLCCLTWKPSSLSLPRWWSCRPTA